MYGTSRECTHTRVRRRLTRRRRRQTHMDALHAQGELVSEPYVKVHIANTGLHYGQSIFEGLKAFAWKDGR